MLAIAFSLKMLYHLGNEAYKAWECWVGAQRIHFDQCRLGQVVEKSTTLATSLVLHHWQGLHCYHGGHSRPSGMTSSALSRYPPLMMDGLAHAIMEFLDTSQIPSMNSQEPSGRTDRPSSLPLSAAMALQEDSVVVQLGFKLRPLRDGGGKPSHGRRPPPSRPLSPLAKIGLQLQHRSKD